MSRRLIFGIVLAVVASAIAAGAVVVVGQGSGSGEGAVRAQVDSVEMGIDPEVTGNTASSLGTVESCVRVDVPAPAFDNVSDYNIDVYVKGDTQAPLAYDAAVTYDATKVHIAAPGTSTLMKLPGAGGFSDALPDRDGRFVAGAAYLSGGPGIGGDGALVRLGLDIGGSGVVTLGFDSPAPLTAYVSLSGQHPVTRRTAQLAINQDCPPPASPAAAPTATPTAAPTPSWMVEPTKIPPVKAVEEWTPYTLPGTPVAGLPLPVDYGRFHIVAPETDPGPYAPAPSPPAGVKAVRIDAKESATLDEFRGHDLFFQPPYIPAGWVLTHAQLSAVVWDDGSQRDAELALQYDRPEYFPITIKRLFLAPGGRVRLVANPEAGVKYTLGEIRGVPVVYDRDPLMIHFVQGNLLTQIEAPLVDLDELIKMADGLIAQTQAPSP